MSPSKLVHSLHWTVRFCFVVLFAMTAIGELFATDALVAIAAPPSADVDTSLITNETLTFTQIDSYSSHTCVLTSIGTIYCWGMNNYGQLGDGTTIDRHAPVKVQGLPGPAGAIAVGDEHTCAIVAGAAFCWGRNSNGELGDGTQITRPLPVQVVGLDHGVTAITAGAYHTCALLNDDEPRCWGGNGAAQIGDGTLQSHSTPTQVNTLHSGVKALDAGLFNTCALLDTGGVKCWGIGPTGDGGDQSGFLYLPRQVAGMESGATQITSGVDHSCALRESGELLCWGYNQNGEVGDGTSEDRAAPVPVSGLNSSVHAIRAGNGATCVITDSAQVICWGDYTQGKLAGGADALNRYRPHLVEGLDEGVIDLALGTLHACAITKTNAIKCWGNNNYGQLGIGFTNDTSQPLAVVVANGDIKAITAGGDHSCELTTAGSVFCWGDNSSGQIGDGSHTDRLTPAQVTGLPSNIIDITAGDNDTCALTSANVLCWGSNRFGQLGAGSNSDSSTPIEVDNLAQDVKAITAGWGHICALTKAGAVYCWGNNERGQLGDGTNSNSNKPQQVSGLSSGVKAISAGWDHTCALLDNGGVKCWGGNTYGQLGKPELEDGSIDRTDSNVPINTIDFSDIPLTGIMAISAGFGHTCAITEFSSLRCWGDYSPIPSEQPQPLGSNAKAQLSAPPVVMDAKVAAEVDQGDPFHNSLFIALTAGYNHSCAITTKAHTVCWGSDSDGQLGNDESGYGPLQNVIAVAAGDNHTCALTNEGKVYCWGKNSRGQLGIGLDSTPVQLSINPFNSRVFLPSVQTEQ